MQICLTKFFLWTIIACLFLSVQVYAESSIVERFDKPYSLRLLINYNYMSLWNSNDDRHTLRSMRPVDVGIGAGFKDFSFDFKYSMGFTSGDNNFATSCFDTGLDFFPKDLWLHLKFRGYQGFSYSEDKDEKEDDVLVDDDGVKLDFRQRDIFASVIWVTAGREQFSVRAPFFLDRIQSKSAGSLLFGGKFQVSISRDHDKVIDFYSSRRDVYSAWVQSGYSYTWVFDNNLFVNIWGLVSLAFGATNDKSFGFIPDVNGKFAFGRWHNLWSWNMVLQMDYSPAIFREYVEHHLLGSFEILVVRRF